MTTAPPRQRNTTIRMFTINLSNQLVILFQLFQLEYKNKYKYTYEFHNRTLLLLYEFQSMYCTIMLHTVMHLLYPVWITFNRNFVYD